MTSFGENAARLSNVASMLLHWRPDDFWNCTPLELVTALTVSTPIEGPDVATIEELRKRFPDELGAA